MNKNSIKDYKVSIYSKSSLSIDDVNVLNLLYAPLIGSNSLLIYLTFSSLKDINDLIHENLFDILNLNEKTFLESRSKLEATGLIETYTGSDTFYYVLYNPQSAESFVKSGVLGVYLDSLVGHENFKKLISNFKAEKLDTSKLTNVTKSFDDVYKIKYDNNVKFNDCNLSKYERAKTVNLKTSFDINDVIDSIDTSFVNGSLDKFKTYLSNVCATYDLSQEEAINLYNQSIKDNTFNLKLFKTKVKTLYNTKHLNSNPEFVYHLEIDNNELNDIINGFKEMTAEDLLNKYNIFTLKNVGLVSEILNVVPYEKSIVFMMIYSVLSKNGKLPSSQYFLSMYNTMTDLGVKDEKSAYAYLFTSNKESNIQSTKQKKFTKNNSPEWANKAKEDILKGFNKVEDDD